MYTFEQILPLIKPSFGEVCCRKRVRFGDSISIDFGRKNYHNDSSLIDLYYGEWSFNCYHKMWRILRGSEVVVEGWKDFENYKEIDDIVQKINFGKMLEILAVNNYDLALILDNDISIEFLSHSEDEETMGIFLPENTCLTFNSDLSWEYERSDLPSPNHLELDK